MARFLIGLIIGLIAGGAIIFFTFVGVPRSATRPGEPIKPPDASPPGGTAQIVLKQDFFNEVLGVIFRDMNDPAFQLSSADIPAQKGGYQYAAIQDASCDGKITILPEGSGVRRSNQRRSGTVGAACAGEFIASVLSKAGARWPRPYGSPDQTISRRLAAEAVSQPAPQA